MIAYDVYYTRQGCRVARTVKIVDGRAHEEIILEVPESEESDSRDLLIFE